MLEGAAKGHLEVRAEGDGSQVIAGRFPYNVTATISDGGRKGRPRKEKFAPKAFERRVNSEDEEVNLLVGHNFDKPLASKLNGTLSLTDTEDALSFEARLTPEVLETQHGKDALNLIKAGLAVGLSPGFRIPPERAVKDAETVTQEPDNPDEGQNKAIIRTVNAAILFELSVVTRPAFDETQVEARNWQPVYSEPSHSRNTLWFYR